MAYTRKSLNAKNRKLRKIPSFLLSYLSLITLKLVAALTIQSVSGADSYVFEIEIIKCTWNLSVEFYGMSYLFEWEFVVEKTNLIYIVYKNKTSTNTHKQNKDHLLLLLFIIKIIWVFNNPKHTNSLKIIQTFINTCSCLPPGEYC